MSILFKIAILFYFQTPKTPAFAGVPSVVAVYFGLVYLVLLYSGSYREKTSSNGIKLT